MNSWPMTDGLCSGRSRNRGDRGPGGGCRHVALVDLFLDFFQVGSRFQAHHVKQIHFFALRSRQYF